MARRPAISRLIAAGLLPLLLVMGAVQEWTLFRCRHDHVVRTEPCCPDEEVAQDEATSKVASIDDAGCCEISQLKLERAPAEPAHAHAGLTPPLLAAVTLAPLGAVSTLSSQRIDAARTRATGPPIILQTRALLI